MDNNEFEFSKDVGLQFLRKLDRKKSFEIGDIFFAPSKAIANWEINNSNISYSDGDSEENQNDTLFAFKYLGDGIVEEMITGTRMIVEKGLDRNFENFLSIDKIRDLDDSVTDNANDYCVPINFKNYSNRDGGVNDYISAAHKFKETSSKYPLIFITRNAVEITELAKETYLNSNNQARKKYIESRIAESEKNIQMINEQLSEEIQKLSDISKETLDMAYLENELYDFEHRKTI